MAWTCGTVRIVFKLCIFSLLGGGRSIAGRLRPLLRPAVVKTNQTRRQRSDCIFLSDQQPRTVAEVEGLRGGGKRGDKRGGSEWRGERGGEKRREGW